jgi:hypothetical protein
MLATTDFGRFGSAETTNRDACASKRYRNPNGQAAPYAGDAYLSNGRYTMTVDVPDGARCAVQFFPSH